VNYCLNTVAAAVVAQMIVGTLLYLLARSFEFTSYPSHKQRQLRTVCAVIAGAVYFTTTVILLSPNGCCLCLRRRERAFDFIAPTAAATAAGAPLYGATSATLAVTRPPAPRGRLCCVVPREVLGSVFTEPTTETALLEHFERLRTAPISLVVSVRCGHWRRRGKHNQFNLTHAYVSWPFCLSYLAFSLAPTTGQLTQYFTTPSCVQRNGAVHCGGRA
jgi:hypothetical protein